MEFFRCIEGRRSYRSFLQKEVEKGILERVIKAANHGPSYRNTQPWLVFVTTGDKKDDLAKKLSEAMAAGDAVTPDLPMVKEWPEELARRGKESHLLRFKAMGVDPSDEKQILKAMSGNFRFFGAPCAIFIGMDKTLTSWSIFDLGIFTHGILLGLEAEGLGGCPQASVVQHADIIRKELEIPSTIGLYICISLGYPDLEAPVNNFQSARRDLGEVIGWYGF